MSTKTKHVIQLFDNSSIYGKDLKSFDARKENTRWRNSIQSQSGFLQNDVLSINRSAINGLFAGDTIVLIDYHRASHQTVSKNIEQLVFGNINNSSFSWKIMQFKVQNQLNLYLKWDYWEIGFPRRNSFKLCHLEKGQPIELKINGKRDFSMSSRKERTFIEKNYIVEYLGEAKTVEFLDASYFPISKTIPTERKEINLMKVLR